MSQFEEGRQAVTAAKKNTMNKWIFFLAFALSLSSCARQESKPPAGKEVAQENGQSKLNGKTKIEKIKSDLAQAKVTLTQEGKYNCCIKDPCNFCALHESSCDCYTDLKKGEHVCIECYAGWQQGNGSDEKIKKENVKTSFVQHSHKH